VDSTFLRLRPIPSPSADGASAREVARIDLGQIDRSRQQVGSFTCGRLGIGIGKQNSALACFEMPTPKVLADDSAAWMTKKVMNEVLRKAARSLGLVNSPAAARSASGKR
jgi:hypothetical protein